MRRLLVATTNPDKLREIRNVLADVPIQLLSLHDVARIEEPDENGVTFQENARLKALHYARPGMLTVAEDSGLEIDALGGDPGIRSARFLRPDASYPERFAEIYRRLSQQTSPIRTARFIAAVAAVLDTNVVFETTGIVEGEIANAPAGMGGFGYDPIFCYPPYGRTLAEISETEKLAVAHRGQAFRALGKWLVEQQQ